MRSRLIVIAIIAVLVAASAAYWFMRPRGAAQNLVLYGNVDLRQIDLPFNDSQRIAAVLVEEGTRVRKGEVLARLDTGRIAPQVAQAEAAVLAQSAVVARLHNGSRPQEIAQARANLDSAKADAANAKRQAERIRSLIERSASQQELDNANATLNMANAKVVALEKTLDLAIEGPRQEDIAQAEAQLRGEEAQLALLRQQLSDATLVAPADAVVRSRLMEAGEMASPQKPVFTLAVTDPKWVRAYVSETSLGKLRPGATATIAVDSFPGHRFEGWIGFISPIAEFTPKSVQTEELRTSLVYEVRVFVKDPQDDLRLGMPATVSLPLNRPTDTAAAPASATR